MPARLREDARRVLEAALAATQAGAAVRHALRTDGDTLHVGDTELDLRAIRRILMVGAGKAVPAMARGALEVLGDRIAGGTLTTRHGHAISLPEIEVWEAGHPLPDACGLAGAARALQTVRGAGPDDLVLCLLTGGASALWPAPPRGIGLGDLQTATDALLRAGTPIGELNAVRRHLSRIGGGGLARAAAPARILTLLVSDVVGDAPEAIGSGPTVPDSATFADALRVLRHRLPAGHVRVRAYLAAGAAGEHPETAKPGDAAFRRASHHVVARNRDALEAAARRGAELGYRAQIVNDALRGEAAAAGRKVAQVALRARDGSGPRLLLWGGETVVTVRGGGTGGRCQELALAAALELDGAAGIAVAALGTDGSDGPTAAAGALVDGGTVRRAAATGHSAADCLARNDSHPLLRAAGDLLVTGPTGTHVNDVVAALVDSGE